VLLCFVLAVLASPFESKAENAALRHQLIVLRRCKVTSGSRTKIAGSFYPAVWLVSINPEGSHNHPARDVRALAQGRFRCYWRWKSRPARHPGKRKSLRRISWVNACPADQRRLVPKIACGGVSWIMSARANNRTSRCSHEGGPCCTSSAIGNLCKQASSSNSGRRLRPPDRAMHQISASFFNVARKLRLRFPTKVVPNTSVRSPSKVPENPLVTSCPAKSGRTKQSAKDVCWFVRR
jgi:hypothetical protein